MDPDIGFTVDTFWRVVVGLLLVIIGLALCLTIVGIPLGIPIIFFAGKPLADKLRIRVEENTHEQRRRA
jgi:uncharacterized membrane protein YccF (DUF307 family)